MDTLDGSVLAVLSKQSGNVKNDDVTSGLMVPDYKRRENTTLDGKELMKLS